MQPRDNNRMNAHSLTTIAAVLVFAQAGLARTETLTLQWSELNAALAGREATVILSTGPRLTGAVTEVRPDLLTMTIRRSSDRQAYAPGQASLPRAEVAEIRIKEIKGPARLIGAAGAGGTAAVGSLGWALSDSRVNVSDGTRVAQWAAITAGPAAGGYLLGRLIDTKHTLIRIRPQP